MRKRFFYWLLDAAKHPEGTIFPRWIKAVSALLFPLDTLFWRIRKNIGYQWENDIWIINGVHYTGQAMRALAEAKGGIYRIKRNGESVTVQSVDKLKGNLSLIGNLAGKRARYREIQNMCMSLKGVPIYLLKERADLAEEIAGLEARLAESGWEGGEQ